jgi:hypothetical protein
MRVKGNESQNYYDFFQFSIPPFGKSGSYRIRFQVLFQASLGAPTGHTPAHAPQEIHTSPSITYLESPSDIQDTGHSLSHAPQLMHASLI